VAELPAQMVVEFTLTVGNGFTVTVPLALCVQALAPSRTVTV